MAEYTANIVTSYILEIPAVHKDLLGHVRHWDNLKAAFEGETLWVKDFSDEQINSALVKGLPYGKLYYIKEGLLFLTGSSLPSKKVPHVLWSPLSYVIPVSLPSFNHNYFGISQKIAVKITQSQNEQPVYAMLAEKDACSNYIQTAPKVRLNKLNWVVAGNKLLIAGTPLLPVVGHTYWLYNDMLVPSGFEFELPLLAKKLKQVIDPHNTAVLLWLEDNTYISIKKEAFMPLSVSSFRLTYSL